MFDRFRANFGRDAFGRRPGASANDGNDLPAIEGLPDLFGQFGGNSFGEGLYRVVHPADLPRWDERIGLAFPEFEGKFVCFGFDWLGSTFAVDLRRTQQGQPAVIMFEPGTGDALEIPANLISFHESGLMEFGEAALAISFYESWRAAGGAVPAYQECVGYKRPLFLGGADSVDNLNLADLDVYWHLTGQMIRQTKGLSEGTPVHLT